MSNNLFFGLMVGSLLSGLIGFAIGKPKGREMPGFFLSLLFGFIGWIIVAIMSPTPAAEAKHKRAVDSALGSAAKQVPVSPADELLKIGTLKEKGILSEAEFQEQKARILGGMKSDPADRR